MIGLKTDNNKAEKYYSKIGVHIRTRINNILNKGIYEIVNKKRVPINLTPVFENYLSQLCDVTNPLLHDIIVAEPLTLEILTVSISQIHPTFVHVGSISNKVLYNIFISSVYEVNKKFSKWDFISEIELDTCPYCNRNYIYSLSSNEPIKPEIDHFFPKSIYPFLGLSFYNLIPSCELCNGINAKHNKDPQIHGLKNPYLLEYSDFKFSYKIASIGVLNPSLAHKGVNVILSSKYSGHLNVFKLDKLYNLHSDHVVDLLIKQKLKYNDEYINQLNKIKGIRFYKADINRAILGNYTEENDVHKRPLAKLYQDIGKELGLI
jgi:hypothetical protein